MLWKVHRLLLHLSMKSNTMSCQEAQSAEEGRCNMYVRTAAAMALFYLTVERGRGNSEPVSVGPRRRLAEWIKKSTMHSNYHFTHANKNILLDLTSRAQGQGEESRSRAWGEERVCDPTAWPGERDPCFGARVRA